MFLKNRNKNQLFHTVHRATVCWFRIIAEINMIHALFPLN